MRYEIYQPSTGVVVYRYTMAADPLAEEIAASLGDDCEIRETVTPADIEREADRRVRLILGADSFEAYLERGLGALMTAQALTDKLLSGAALSPEEEALAGKLRTVQNAVAVIRRKQAELSVTLPVNYTADEAWA